MNMRQRIAAVLALTAAAAGGLTLIAAAAPMPWEASRQPAAPTHTGADHQDGTATILCSGGCPQ